MIPEAQSISVHHSDQKLEIVQKILCDSKNVIYIAECKVCNKQSIGSTTQKFKDRIKQYQAKLRKKYAGQKTNLTVLHKTNEYNFAMYYFSVWRNRNRNSYERTSCRFDGS